MLQQGHKYLVTVLANLVLGHPGPCRSLSPGCKATVPWHGWVPRVPPGWECGTVIIFLSDFYHFSVLGSSWFGSFSALTEGLVLLQCASVRRSWEGDCIQWAQPWASVCLLNFLG